MYLDGLDQVQADVLVAKIAGHLPTGQGLGRIVACKAPHTVLTADLHIWILDDDNEYVSRIKHLDSERFEIIEYCRGALHMRRYRRQLPTGDHVEVPDPFGEGGSILLNGFT